MYNSKIIGLGKYLPDNIVSNADLEKIMDTTDAWIQERTGIRERRHIVKGSDDTTFTMGVKASKIAIERAGITSKEIDLILFRMRMHVCMLSGVYLILFQIILQGMMKWA